MFEISCTYLQEIVVPRLSFIQGAPHLVQKKKVCFKMCISKNNIQTATDCDDNNNKILCGSRSVTLSNPARSDYTSFTTSTSAVANSRQLQQRLQVCAAGKHQQVNVATSISHPISNGDFHMLQPMFSLSCVRAQLFSDPLATLFSKESR